MSIVSDGKRSCGAQRVLNEAYGWSSTGQHLGACRSRIKGRKEDSMKWMIIAVLVGIALVAYALLVASSHTEDKETYEAYERWKERRKK